MNTRTTAARLGWAIPQPQSHRTLKLNSTLYQNIRQYLYWNGTILSPCLHWRGNHSRRTQLSRFFLRTLRIFVVKIWLRPKAAYPD